MTGSLNHLFPVCLERRLDQIIKEHNRLPPLNPTAKSLLRLAGQESDERTWQEILRYILDPTENHGLGDTALRQFCLALTEVDTVNNHEPALDEVPTWQGKTPLVETEVYLDDRPVDLVIRCPGDWFICIEMKIWASEGSNQTLDYAGADTIGDEDVELYGNNRYYVYLSREGTASDSPKFTDYSWRHIARYLRRILSGESTQSVRGLAQIREFTDAISHQLGFHMTSNNTQHPIDDRVELYNRNRNDLETLESAFKEFAKREAGRWQKRFLKTTAPDEWDKDWFTYPRKDTEGHIYHRDWTFSPDGPDELSKAPLFHLEFDINPDQLRKGEMEFRFSVSGGPENPGKYNGDQEYIDWRDQIRDLIDEYPEFEESLPHHASLEKNKNHFVKTVYSEREFDEEEFYNTIADGFNDHYEAAKILTEIIKKDVNPDESRIRKNLNGE